MEVEKFEIAGPLLFRPKVFRDNRGFFLDRFNAKILSALGLQTQFVQDNHSRSTAGVLRGLHYQYNSPQGKLVGVVRGKILDIAVDIRAKSPTFGKSLAIELDDQNPTLFWIPPGFAHGFCVLGDEPADVLYKVDQYYNPQGEGGIKFDDPELAIRWPFKEAVISDRDRALMSFDLYKKNPQF